MMEIEPASHSPVAFNTDKFIRVGSVKKRLRDHPEKEKALWQIFAHKSLSMMDRSERVLACYLHACLRYVSNQPMNNTSIRKRFGLPTKSVARASVLLREALDSDVIVIRDPEAGTRNRTYLPFWAD